MPIPNESPQVPKPDLSLIRSSQRSLKKEHHAARQDIAACSLKAPRREILVMKERKTKQTLRSLDLIALETTDPNMPLFRAGGIMEEI